MSTLSVRISSTDELFGSPEMAGLLAMYADESRIIGLPAPVPDVQQYVSLEQTGLLHVAGAWVDGRLVGFFSLIVYRSPHYSALLAVTESLFVAPEDRASGAGMRLLRLAEETARMNGAVGFLVSAPAGGQLDAVIERMDSWRLTNRAYFKIVAFRGEGVSYKRRDRRPDQALGYSFPGELPVVLNRWQMPRQVHAVMQESQNIDHLTILSAGDLEHDEMSPLATVPRDMKRPDVATDFGALLGPNG